MSVIKRNGREVKFNFSKIKSGVSKAAAQCGGAVASQDFKELQSLFDAGRNYNVEEIQNIVEGWLMSKGLHRIAKSFILYREEHKKARFVKDRIAYIDKYVDGGKNASTSSETDPNANVMLKNVANLEGEVYKVQNRQVQREHMFKKLTVMYPEVAKQYEKDVEHHIIYPHDESCSPVQKPYCMAASLFPLMTEGVGNIDGVTPAPPNDIKSYSGQVTNLVFSLSSQVKGAVALGEYLVAMNYYVIAEFGEKWYEHLDDVVSTGVCRKVETVRSRIHDGFKQFIWGVNQPAGNRSYQSPFTNVSYYDHTYFESLFADFRYPDGTAPEWKAVDTLQRMFMKFFNKLRLKAVLTFPVETLAMVYNPETGEIVDKEYRELCAEMYAEGHSFFTYISDSADSLSSCCFSKDTKVLWKSSTSGVMLTTLEELHDMKWEPDKKNLRIFHNGSWVKGKSVKLANRPMYKVVTFNNKEYVMTNNHINVTLAGEKRTSELTTDDYLMFNNIALQAVNESDENLSYEQGFVVGAFLGDGSFGSEIEGVVYDINFSQNKNKYRKMMDCIDIANEQVGGESKSVLNKIYNNVYPVRISSKNLAAFIMKWTNWERGVHAENKELNLNCLLQSYEFRKGILDGWYNTDGGNANRCYTSSKRLAECMEVLITSLGLNSIIDISDRTDEKVVIRGEEYKRNYPLYCVRWYEPGTHRANKSENKSWIKKNNSIYFRIKSIESVPYDDEVYCIECSNQDEPYFTLPGGLITHNCRLKNEIKENTFSPTSGMTGIMTGSCNVITLNFNRIVQDWYREVKTGITVDYIPSKEEIALQFGDRTSTWVQSLRQHICNILDRVYKYHIAYKTMLYELEEKGMYASSNAGYIYLKKLYSTVGINGLNEAARFFGLHVSNNEEYIHFLQFILSTVKDQNKLYSVQDKRRPFIFNSEVVPAEGLGAKNYNWDKADGYWVPEDENLYNSYFYNAHDPETTVLDKFQLHGRQTFQYTDGGSALHCNLDSHLSKEQYLKLIDYAVKNGTSYFTFNIPNSKDNKCGYIHKGIMNVCPKCGSKDITQYTRVIGYLRPVTSFGADRQIEATKRIYSDGKKEMEEKL